MIAGFLINKFRGDPTLLDPGFDMLEARTGVPTIGVLPWFDLRDLPQEDALEWAQPDRARDVAADAAPRALDIVIARLPRVANLDEFQPLLLEPGVRVRFVGHAGEFGAPELVIIPGTKSTMDDLHWLRERGLADCIQRHAAAGGPVLGICGGYQMLGHRIDDPAGVEGQGSVEGLRLLPVITEFSREKVTRRVRATPTSAASLWQAPSVALPAYEIHMGRTTALDQQVELRPARLQAIQRAEVH